VVLNGVPRAADSGQMNAIAHASALPASGPRLDNRRVLAALIDLVIVGAGAALILFAADALPGGSAGAELGSGLYLLTTAWALYYYFACESGSGQTLGKRAMRLRVVRADGATASMGEIAVRTILRVIDGIGLYLVGMVVMLVSGKRRQRLGDMAGGTIVVDASATPAAAPQVAVPAAAAPIVPARLGTSTVTLPEVEEPEEAPPAPADPLTPFEPIMGEDAEPEEPEEAAVQVTPVFEPLPAVEPASRPVPVMPEPPVVTEEPEPASEDQERPVEDAPVVVRSVETVSAIDLVMGDEDEGQDASEEGPEDASGPLAPPAGR
jgi:uncharacterized RDD family membrane protein YckC